MTNDKSGVRKTGENSGANAMADEDPVNGYENTSVRWPGIARLCPRAELADLSEASSGCGDQIAHDMRPDIGCSSAFSLALWCLSGERRLPDKTTAQCLPSTIVVPVW